MPKAKWPSRCSRCDTGILRGDDICKRAGKWIHSSCSHIATSCVVSDSGSSGIPKRSGAASGQPDLMSGFDRPKQASLSGAQNNVSVGCGGSCGVSGYHAEYLYLMTKSLHPESYMQTELALGPQGYCIRRRVREKVPRVVAETAVMTISERLSGYRFVENHDACIVNAQYFKEVYT